MLALAMVVGSVAFSTVALSAAPWVVLEHVVGALVVGASPFLGHSLGGVIGRRLFTSRRGGR